MVAVLSKSGSAKEADLAGGFIVLIRKDDGWTSFDVVNKLRFALRQKKVGHAGTLDPFATGLLIVGVGKGTKELSRFSELSKRYRAEITFGVETDSYDRTGEVVRKSAVDHLDLRDIEAWLQKHRGPQSQTPPMFSAKKINGVRLYKLARKKKEIAREPVQVHIYDSRIVKWEKPVLQAEFHVSKGTYLRSIAYDMGQELGVGAHLSALERTQIGDFKVADSYSITEFITFWRAQVHN